MKTIGPRYRGTPGFRHALAAAGLAFVTSGSLAGCESTTTSTKQSDATGALALALDLAPGVSITTVSYSIAGPANYAKTGSFDLAQSHTLSALIAGIPTGHAYTISLSATTREGAAKCLGTATFDIVAGTTTRARVHLLCHEPGTTGSVLVNGTINICPVLDGISASPAEVDLGGHIHLSAVAHDTDGAPSPLVTHWQGGTEVGTLSSSEGVSTDFACGKSGIAVITASVSDGDSAAGCVATSSVTVTCSTALGSVATDALVRRMASVAAATIDANVAPRGLDAASFSIAEILDESAIALDDLADNGGQATWSPSGRRLVVAVNAGYRAAVVLRKGVSDWGISQIRGHDLANPLAEVLAFLRSTRSVDGGSFFLINIPGLHLTLVGHREGGVVMLTTFESRNDLPLVPRAPAPARQVLASLAEPAKEWATQAMKFAATAP